jgi:hypothetical protein
VGVRVPVVPGTNDGQLVPFCEVNIGLPVLRVWQQVGASGFWWFGFPTLPPGLRCLWILLGRDRRGGLRIHSICDRCVYARVAT